MPAGEPLYWRDMSKLLYTSTPNYPPFCPSCDAATCPHCGKALPAQPAEVARPIWIVPSYTWYPYPNGYIQPYPYTPYAVNQGSTTIAGLPDGVTVTYSESES